MPEVSTAELSGSETSGIDADLSYYGVQQPDTPTLGDGRLSSEDSAQLDLQEVASTISSSSNSGNEGHEGRVVTVPALRTRSRSASPVHYLILESRNGNIVFSGEIFHHVFSF